MGIEEHVDPQREIESLVVDPLLESEDSSVVYLEFALGLLQKSIHFVE